MQVKRRKITTILPPQLSPLHLPALGHLHKTSHPAFPSPKPPQPGLYATILLCNSTAKYVIAFTFLKNWFRNRACVRVGTTHGLTPTKIWNTQQYCSVTTVSCCRCRSTRTIFVHHTHRTIKNELFIREDNDARVEIVRLKRDITNPQPALPTQQKHKSRPQSHPLLVQRTTCMYTCMRHTHSISLWYHLNISQQPQLVVPQVGVDLYIYQPMHFLSVEIGIVGNSRRSKVVAVAKGRGRSIRGNVYSPTRRGSRRYDANGVGKIIVCGLAMVSSWACARQT